MHGEGPFLTPGDPPGHGTRPPRPGPIFTYTPWLSMGSAFLATTAISAALYARGDGSWSARRDVAPAGGALLTASKWQRVETPTPRITGPGSTTERAPRGSSCSDGRWTEQWVPNPRFVPSSSGGRAARSRSEHRRLRERPRADPARPGEHHRAGPLLPTHGGGDGAVPSAEWVEAAARGRRSAPAGPHPRGGLVDPALVAEGAVVEVEHPDHGRLRQAGSSTG